MRKLAFALFALSLTGCGVGANLGGLSLPPARSGNRASVPADEAPVALGTSAAPAAIRPIVTFQGNSN